MRLIDTAKELAPEARTVLIRRGIQAASLVEQKAYRKWLDAQIKIESSKDDAKSQAYFERLDTIYKEAIPSSPLPSPVPSDVLAVQA